MNSMGVRAALAFLLLFIATVEAAEGGVTFSKRDFTMTCPEKGDWFKKQRVSNNSISHTLPYDDKSKGFYHCKYEKPEVTYYFYVRGKVCDNCFELDAALFGWVIIVDVVATGCLMAVIFRCTKKKSSAGLSHAPKAPARPAGGRPPPEQDRHYEPLSNHTRSQGTYSAVNRMG